MISKYFKLCNLLWKKNNASATFGKNPGNPNFHNFNSISILFLKLGLSIIYLKKKFIKTLKTQINCSKLISNSQILYFCGAITNEFLSISIRSLKALCLEKAIIFERVQSIKLYWKIDSNKKLINKNSSKEEN